MDDDDRPLGRLLSRREVLALLGTTGLWMLTGCGQKARARDGGEHAALAGRVRRPAGADRGPVLRGRELLNRSDIRADPSDGARATGAPLELDFQVSRLATAPARRSPGALVDVWHCDAAGRLLRRARPQLRHDGARSSCAATR